MCSKCGMIGRILYLAFLKKKHWGNGLDTAKYYRVWYRVSGRVPVRHCTLGRVFPASLMPLWEGVCLSGQKQWGTDWVLPNIIGYRVPVTHGIVSFLPLWEGVCLSILSPPSSTDSSAGNFYHAWFAVDRKTQTETSWATYFDFYHR